MIQACDTAVEPPPRPASLRPAEEVRRLIDAAADGLQQIRASSMLAEGRVTRLIDRRDNNDLVWTRVAAP